jgi:SAM-dependent methyltransferase
MAQAKNYSAFLVDMLATHLPADGSVLDFGAGIGHFAGRLRDLGFSITCIEPDPALASQLAGRGFPCPSSLQAVGSERHQAAYALNVLEHIEDDDEILDQLHRVLVPEGVLVIYVPAFQILFSSMDRKVGHVRRYRKAVLKCKVQAHGFQVLHCAYIDILGFLATLLFRALGNRRGDLNPWGLRAFDRLAFPLSRCLDRLTSPLAGKNLLIVAKKTQQGSGATTREKP